MSKITIVRIFAPEEHMLSIGVLVSTDGPTCIVRTMFQETTVNVLVPHRFDVAVDVRCVVTFTDVDRLQPVVEERKGDLLRLLEAIGADNAYMAHWRTCITEDMVPLPVDHMEETDYVEVLLGLKRRQLVLRRTVLAQAMRIAAAEGERLVRMTLTVEEVEALSILRAQYAHNVRDLHSTEGNVARTLLYRFPIDGAQFRASFRALMSELGDVQDVLDEVEGMRAAGRV